MSLKLLRNVPPLSLDFTTKGKFQVKMVHSIDRKKDYTKVFPFTFGNIKWMQYLVPKFYEKAMIQQEGFVHPDGSL